MLLLLLSVTLIISLLPKGLVGFSYLVTPKTGVAYFARDKYYTDMVSVPNMEQWWTGFSSSKSTYVPNCIDYHYHKKFIFYSSNNNIYRFEHQKVTSKAWSPIIVLSFTGPVVGLVVDWKWNLLYSQALLDEYSSALYVSNLDGTHKTLVNQYHTNNLWFMGCQITIDPYRRILFHLGEYLGKIYKVDTETNNIDNVDLLGKYKMHEVLNVAVDVEKQRLFAIGRYSPDTTAFLVSVNYQGSKFRVDLERKDLTAVVSMDAMDGLVFFALGFNKKITFFYFNYELYEHPKELSSIAEDIGDGTRVKLYHEIMQTSGRESYCTWKKCSHHCVFSTLLEDQCWCPKGSLLWLDNKTCMNVKKC